MPKQLAVNPTGNDTADTFQRRAKTAVGALQGAPFSSGTVLTVDLTTDPTPVFHLLKRVPLGYAILDKTQAGDVYRDATFSGDRTQIISLVASVAGSYTLYIF